MTKKLHEPYFTTFKKYNEPHYREFGNRKYKYAKSCYAESTRKKWRKIYKNQGFRVRIIRQGKYVSDIYIRK